MNAPTLPTVLIKYTKYIQNIGLSAFALMLAGGIVIAIFFRDQIKTGPNGPLNPLAWGWMIYSLILFGIAGISFLIATLQIIIIYIKIYSLKKYLLKHGKETTAKIVSMRSMIATDRVGGLIRYELEYNGVKGFTFDTWKKKDQWEHLKVGDQVHILYDPENTSTGVIEKTSS